MSELATTPLRRQRRGLLALAAFGGLGSALGLGGCAVGPDFQAPADEAPASFTRGPAPDGDAPAPIAETWWTAYGSPAIDALVAQALARNPGIDAAQASLRAAQENVTAQRGLFYPQVQAGYGVSRQNAGQVLSSPLANGDALYTLHTAQLSVGFVADIFGGNRRQVESLQAQSASQALQLAALRVTLASNVVAAVIQEAMLAEQIRLVEETVDVNGRQVEHLRRLQAAGYSSGIDLASQEAAYAQAVALLPPLRKQREQTRDLLATLCGRFPSDRLEAASLGAIRVPDPLPRSLPSQLVAQRPDVQAALKQAHAATAQVGVAAANLLPQVSLTAALGFSKDALAGLLAADNRTWGLSAGLTQPLFAGGTLRARKRGAEAAAEAALAQYRSAVLAAFQNVADVLYALDADAQALAAARQAQAANARLLAMAQRQFELGYTSGLNLLAARQTDLQARAATLAAQGQYLGDTVALYQALGGGWSAQPGTGGAHDHDSKQS